jgi:hypothetical protein
VTNFEAVAIAIAYQEGFHVEGSRSHRNNNPGNLKMGKLARKFGAIGMDDEHHAVFPNTTMGLRALRYLLKTKFKGMCLRDIGKVWAEDPKWAENVCKISGVGIDEVIKDG